ncbi:MAG: dethiobiotin synthase [Verrucomicrobiales bacterium]|jgi:dethiobiotin synthetase|nr:dethiobiotin synthase [Verrucomicrobiales bacterium]
MNGRGIFITGTDTGVGKTWVTTRLIQKLRASGIDAVGMKPVECGGQEDSLAIFKASGGDEAGLTLEMVNPFSLSEPLAPAAATISRPIDFPVIRAAFNDLADRHEFVIVEGAGGWLVPLDHERTMADLAVALALPVILVAANRLGVLNHSLLTVRAIRESGLVCRGLFLNQPDPTPDLSARTNHAILQKMLPEIAILGMDLDGLVDLSLE